MPEKFVYTICDSEEQVGEKYVVCKRTVFNYM